MRNLSSTNLLPTMDELFRDLNRFAIGFEPMITRIHSLQPNQTAGYPPYNLESDGSTYRLELAVAGFKMEELDIFLTNDRILIVRGRKATDQNERNWLHRGIAGRDFERQFTLAEHIKVISAKMEDGLLIIELEREVPEANKGRIIPITNGSVIDVPAASE
jgi:molecular chaperone IbpA